MGALLPGETIRDIGNSTEIWGAVHAKELYAQERLADATGSVTVAELRAHLDTPAGDMRAAVYDPDGDGKVAAALTADSATTAAQAMQAANATYAASAGTAATAGQVLGVGGAGTSRYYGTDASGAAGFHALPTASGGASAAHAASHAAGGSDSLTASAIGAAAVAHAHTISGVTGLLAALEAKAELTHTHGSAAISGLSSALQGLQDQIDSLEAGTGGSDGQNAYVYLAFASDGTGADFSPNSPGATSAYLAVLATTTTIANPQASDFAGRWVKIRGEQGGLGATGADGVGVPAGGGAGQILAKKTAADFDAEWIDVATSGTSAVSSVNGYSGAVMLGKADIGLGGVENTADADKPVSIPVQAALDAKANSTHAHAAASVNAAGFLSPADKTKLDGIAAGAQVNTVVSVNTLTGAIVLDAAGVGAASAAHTHAQGEVAGLSSSLAAKAPLLQAQVEVSAASGTLTKNVMNILTGSTAGTYAMPTLADGEWVGLFPRTGGHTVAYDGTRLFWFSDGAVANSFTVANDERGMGVLVAFGASYVGGLK